MAFGEDLSQFFSQDDFAVTAIFKRNGSTIATCDVIFDATVEQLGMEQVAITTDAPTLLVKSSDVASVKRTDTCTIDAKVYNIAAIRPDGTGVTRIDLEFYA